MEKRSFEVGDIVRIRSWDDMASEFGYTEKGHINCEAIFTLEMQHLCGEEAEIVAGQKYVTLRFLDNPRDTGWTYTTDMLEHINEKAFDYPNEIGFEELI